MNDRWFNPTDTVARYYSMYNLQLYRDKLKIKDDNWHNVRVKWTQNGKAVVYVDDRKHLMLPLENNTEHGVSYVHFISGNTPGPIGIFIESVKASLESFL